MIRLPVAYHARVLLPRKRNYEIRYFGTFVDITVQRIEPQDATVVARWLDRDSGQRVALHRHGERFFVQCGYDEEPERRPNETSMNSLALADALINPLIVNAKVLDYLKGNIGSEDDERVRDCMDRTLPKVIAFHQNKADGFLFIGDDLHVSVDEPHLLLSFPPAPRGMAGEWMQNGREPKATEPEDTTIWRNPSLSVCFDRFSNYSGPRWPPLCHFPLGEFAAAEDLLASLSGASADIRFEGLEVFGTADDNEYACHDILRFGRMILADFETDLAKESDALIEEWVGLRRLLGGCNLDEPVAEASDITDFLQSSKFLMKRVSDGLFLETLVQRLKMTTIHLNGSLTP